MVHTQDCQKNTYYYWKNAVYYRTNVMRNRVLAPDLGLKAPKPIIGVASATQQMPAGCKLIQLCTGLLLIKSEGTISFTYKVITLSMFIKSQAKFL